MAILTALTLVLAGCGDKTPIETELPSRSATEARKAELQAALAARYENPERHYQLAKIFHQEGTRPRAAEFHYNVAMGFDSPTHRVGRRRQWFG
jgi:predicted small lipoprotein YifL